MVPQGWSNARIWTAALLLCVSAAAAGVEERKPEPPQPAPEKAEPKAEDAAADAARQPVIRPAGPEDGRRIEALLLRLSEWESTAVERTAAGLKVRALIVPDAFAYRVAKAYFERRGQGDTHTRALAMVARNLPGWKRFEKQSLLAIELENPTPKLGGDDRRVFTLEAKNAAKQVELTDAKRRKLLLRFAEKPKGLRQASLSIQKFWVTSDGATTRRPRFPGDPASVGREPLVSKPFAALVLEEKPARLDLLVSRRTLERTGSREFRVAISQWKKYEGPFEKDRLDLNLGRSWDEVKDLDLQVSLPPAGLATSPELQELVEEARAAAER
ncbi:MAG: hypothetical protein JXA90_13110 [Planctomycetes bacterium]|nr:hypothetical protein [Planctomycetota bacterium]